MVNVYRSVYHVTSTDPTTPLGAAPTQGSEQASVYKSVNREWRAMTMTNAASNPGNGDINAEIQRGLDRLQARDADRAAEKERAARAEVDSPAEGATQDGVTDEYGYGHGTGYTDRYYYGGGEGSHMGY